MVADPVHIYQHHARTYERVFRHEDHEGNLSRALTETLPLAGARVVDVGTGTGRMARMMLDAGAAAMICVDREPAMLEVALEHLEERDDDEGVWWYVTTADAAALPVQDGWADVTVAGWALGHLRDELGRGWRPAVDRAVAEMLRVTRPGGMLVILESLGIAGEEPAPPTRDLSQYYRRLERRHGFERRVLRTDFAFASATEAAEQLGTFFGAEVARRVRGRDRATVPEFTGLWVRARELRPRRVVRTGATMAQLGESR